MVMPLTLTCLSREIVGKMDFKASDRPDFGQSASIEDTFIVPLYPVKLPIIPMALDTTGATCCPNLTLPPYNGHLVITDT
jgi:hypothetical protein